MSERRPREKAEGGESLVGSEWTVDVGPVAHGGHCVARHEGQVLFVRHALPGERVLARVTEGRVGDSVLRADAVSVETPSPDRVEAPCRYAAPGLCGGCDFQHVSLAAQRGLKAAVVREQFSRLAHLDVEVVVQPVPGDEAGLRWRTRVEFAVDDLGRPGLRQHRSHAIVAVDDCLIATHGVIDSGVLDTDWPDLQAVDVIDAAHPEEPVLVPLPVAPGSDGSGGLVGERVWVAGRDSDLEVKGEAAADTHGEPEDEGGHDLEYVVSARGFWQVHPGAAT
ncbi:MAG: TRAM domain-containing protein, partial [Humibacillus sp.]